MLVTCWSTKGGSGTTVISALASLHAAQDRDRPVLLVDLCGDLPAAFGSAETPSGLGEWLRSDLAPCSLERILLELAPNLSLLPRGQGPLSARRTDEFAEWLASGASLPGAHERPARGTDEFAEWLASGASLPGAHERPARGTDEFAEWLASGAAVVVDAGMLRTEGEASSRGSDDELRWRLAAEADRSVLVTRACYLALRRAVSLPVRPSGVVLVAEPGRALTRSDCERAIGAPVLATVAVDPEIARAVDAGMLRTRVPKGAMRALGRLIEEM